MRIDESRIMTKPARQAAGSGSSDRLQRRWQNSPPLHLAVGDWWPTGRPARGQFSRDGSQHQDAPRPPRRRTNGRQAARRRSRSRLCPMYVMAGS
jgi:hypothetical protein